MTMEDVQRILAEHNRELDVQRRQTERAAAGGTFHIRRRAAKLPRGNGFYLQRPANDPQARTLCGATSTVFDLAWAEAKRMRAPRNWEDLTLCAMCWELKD
jgi:hypothetical protein